MKVLFVHNYYGSNSPSGENVVVDEEVKLLRKFNHSVELFSRHSDEILSLGVFGKIKGAVTSVWNPFAAESLMKCINKFKPDVVHVHNTFPLISTSIFHSIGTKAAKVLTLHNYRIMCPAAIPLRDGNVCTLCIDTQTVHNSIKYKCYRNSFLSTLPLAANVYLNRKIGTWVNNVDAFITLSNFQRDLMIHGGLSHEKIHVKPNFFSGNPNVIKIRDRDNQVVFVGRLSEEKGVLTLIRAWKSLSDSAPKLIIVGDGPLRTELEKLSVGLNIHFVGQVKSVTAQKIISRSKLLLLPSECFEGFPMVIREAFAYGTPVAVSDIGPLPSIVTHGVNGMVFNAGNPNSIANTVKLLFNDDLIISNISNQARQSFEKLYNEQMNHDLLLSIYHVAINQNNRMS